jgi:hypothetical protein
MEQSAYFAQSVVIFVTFVRGIWIVSKMQEPENV